MLIRRAFWSLVLLTCLGTSGPLQAQPAVVDGRVVSANGSGIAYAHVRLAGTTIGTATDSTGHFRLSTHRVGRDTLRASAVGHEAGTVAVRLVAGDTVNVALTLPSARLRLDEATVVGEAYGTGPSAQATLAPTEAMTTPGAAGDLLRALQTFPGVAAPGDGAGLFVRGGDASETKTLLDGAPVHHPYRYESPAGGSFGTVPPFLIEGTQFSTGGFSAQYGNALSGVLAMASPDRPQQARQYVNVGLAAASVSLDQPLVDDALGLRLSGTRSFTGLLFRVNGHGEDYATVPQGTNGTLSLTWDDPTVGQVKGMAFVRRSRLGVETTEGAYTGRYRSRTTNQLYTLQWTTGGPAWTVETSAAWTAFSSRKQFGTLDLSPTDAAATLRVDASRTTAHGTLRAGGLIERRRYRLAGTVPTQPDAVGPRVPSRSLDAAPRRTWTGGYAEGVVTRWAPLTARVGLRADASHRTGAVVVDPRVALTWQITPQTRLRTAWGRYHQFPALETAAEHTGPSALRPQQAQHLVLGLRHEHDDLLLRAAAYHKPYRDLVVRTGASRYANAGDGFAQGLDLFAKYGAFLETRINGWAAYSLLRAHRTQPRDVGSTIRLDQGPAPYDLTHQFTLVGKVRVIGQLRVGGTYRAVSGRPITPVVGTERSPSGALLPVDGAVGSERLPAYQRLDLQLSYYWPFNQQQHLIAYAAVQNTLDRTNAVDVTYAPDYSTRQYRTTHDRRSVYVGLTLTL